MEQKEKQELQKKHEVDIAKHQEWVRRLVVEVSALIRNIMCINHLYMFDKW